MNVLRGKKTMRIKKMVIGMVGTNCYLVWDEKTKECFAVDPAAPAQPLVEFIHSEGLKLQAILLTHGHFDHIMGIDTLLEEKNVPVYASCLEEGVLTDPGVNLSGAYGGGYVFKNAVYLEDQEELEVAGYRIRLMSTPGHTAGSCCYYIPAEDILFSGDTLFAGSVGRTDFPTGSMGMLIRSVKQKLMTLPEDVQVYPGHMEATSIGFEKENNPYLL